MHSDFSIVWLIPLFPLIGFILNGLGAHKVLSKKGAGVLACAMMLCSFIVAVMVFLKVQASPGPHIATLMPWFSISSATQPGVNFVVNWEALVDPLTSLMLLIITGVGGLIHWYSTGYMASDRGMPRFFVYLNLFIFFMLMLVMGNNMAMMFVGWEGVGLCSYLLIGFYYDRDSAAAAALKAMVVNRVGDVGVLIGMFMAYRYFGTLDFYQGAAGIHGILDQSQHIMASVLVGAPAAAAMISTLAIMVFWGCTGKSAQIPLYTWLPDAMEGPTPVSALIHAATMVTAGIYLVSRMHSLFELSQLAMTVVAVIGMATALFAATMGLAQNDIKRILAYSTVSQLGYMFAACGCGAFAAGMFHVMTHAFFKACLFLGSGIVIHGMEHAMHERESTEHGGHDADQTAAGDPDPHDPQDTRNMGGLAKKMPWTYTMMMCSTLAIAGIVPFSGFFSKDEILSQAFGSGPYGWVLWLVGVTTAGITAFYMMRLMYKTFLGKYKTDDAEHAQEADLRMIGPVAILGVLALVGGWVGMPSAWVGESSPLHGIFTFLSPAVGALPEKPMSLTPMELMGISLLVAALGLGISWSSYKGREGGDLIPREAKPGNRVYQIVLHKYYIDEFYYWIFTVGGRALSKFIAFSLDLGIIDGIVNGVGKLIAQIGNGLRSMQTGFVRNYAFSMLIGVLFVIIACFMGFHHITLH